jgi:hypothetical protein
MRLFAAAVAIAGWVWLLAGCGGLLAPLMREFRRSPRKHNREPLAGPENIN